MFLLLYVLIYTKSAVEIKCKVNRVELEQRQQNRSFIQFHGLLFACGKKFTVPIEF